MSIPNHPRRSSSSIGAMSCSSASASSASSRWADVPNDILELLVRSMDSHFDRLRFGAVCRSWRDVSAAVKQNPAGRCGVAPLPILTFRDPADGVRGVGDLGGKSWREVDAAFDEQNPDWSGVIYPLRIMRDPANGALHVPLEVADAGGATPPVTRCFYSLSEDKVYRLQVPSESREWRCFGCSRGWLGMIDLSAKPFLFDPISGARVDLPSLTTLITRLIVAVKKRKSDGETVYIYKEPDDSVRRGYPITAMKVRDTFINRLALSSSPLDHPNCIIMTTVSNYRLPAYTRPGDDDAWVPVPDLPSECWHFGDVVYHEGVFYAVAGIDVTLAITFGHSNSPPSVEVLVPLADFLFGSHGNYLVVLPSGDLLLVTRHREDDFEFGKTELFELYKLTVDKQLGAAAWVEVEDIGDCCLFLGTAYSMSLPASEILGKYRANCIFFTEDPKHSSGENYMGLDHGIYEIEEGTVEHFCHIDERGVLPQLMWLTPRF